VLFGEGGEKAWYVRRFPAFTCLCLSSGQLHGRDITILELLRQGVYVFSALLVSLERCWARAANGTHCCDISEGGGGRVTNSEPTIAERFVVL
jgi:hypothetical protein